NVRRVNGDAIGISLNETTSLLDVTQLLVAFGITGTDLTTLDEQAAESVTITSDLLRTDAVLTYPLFNSYHSETDMLRYLKRLEAKDIALNQSMIPLGSCTMKLNATAEMIPVTWPEFGKMHPFAPMDQAQGYRELFEQLQTMLEICTGYD